MSCLHAPVTGTLGGGGGAVGGGGGGVSAHAESEANPIRAVAPKTLRSFTLM